MIKLKKFTIFYNFYKHLIQIHTRIRNINKKVRSSVKWFFLNYSFL